jgi:ketosteroid isomerase-like protein
VLRWRRPQTLIAATPSATRTHPIANPINPLAGTTERVSQRESRHWNHRKMMTAAIERSDCNDMVLSGSYRGMNGEETRVRGTWRRDGSEVQETTRISTDGGNTWRTWFDLVFRRAGTRAETNDDTKIVASLDTQYQAADKHNDVATMDRILADDFVLVTGSGNVVTKNNLLEEARAARTIYEHQEDSEQMIRVWGNTAVVTAKLWAKGLTEGQSFEYTLWFSDTYARTPGGWRYVFDQASSRLTTRP